MRPELGLRRTDIREWMALPPEKPRTSDQATAFAAKAAGAHRFDSGGDPQARVLAWLTPRTGKA